MKGLPPILVFLVVVANWSDGTAAPMHQEQMDHNAIETSTELRHGKSGLPSELSVIRKRSEPVFRGD